MTKIIYTSRKVAFPHYEGRFGVAYRIEIDVTDFPRTYQRHIWSYADGGDRADAWIPSLRLPPETLERDGYTKMATA